MFLFNKREVYIGYSMNDMANVRDALGMENIKYTYKVKNNAPHGTLGMNMDYTTQYYVYVKKDDFEKAKYLVNGALFLNK